jgi:hypothetical protein
VVLCLPGFVAHFVSNPLWTVIWPNTLSQMSGKALAVGRRVVQAPQFAAPLRLFHRRG